jgi:hypothetical protein
LQALAIEDFDAAARIPDEAGFLQIRHCQRNTWPPDPKHHSKKLLRQQKFVGWHPVAGHQQPATASLVKLVKVCTGGGLCHLIEQGVDITKHNSVERGATFKLLTKYAGLHSQRLTRNLHVHGRWGMSIAENNGYSHHSLAANRANFHGGTVFHFKHE